MRAPAILQVFLLTVFQQQVIQRLGRHLFPLVILIRCRLFVEKRQCLPIPALPVNLPPWPAWGIFEELRPDNMVEIGV